MIQFFCIMKEWYNYFQWAARALLGENGCVVEVGIGLGG